MPPASQTEHRVVSDTALPYISNSSVTSTDPQFVQGSQNILTSIRNYSERFPGFSALFAPGGWKNLQRQFVWRRWASSAPNGGKFIWMGCDIRAGVATVWAWKIGDAVASLIWTSSTAEPFDFVVANNICYFGNGTDMLQYDSSSVVTWGIAGPVSGPSLTLISGTNNVFTSWCYCVTYWDANKNHESSPSPISACSGVFSNKSVNIGLTASTNPRVTGIRVYRTPDGGAQDPAEMQEITGSPFANATATVNDATLDVNLSIRVAPAFLRNDPPTPCKGFVSYAGRIWGFANNTVYYSGFEEISNGVPEECWPSGLNGNFYPYANEVDALAALIDGVAVYQALLIGKIEGDSLDTFRRYNLLARRGTRSRTSVSALGGSVVWFDTSGTVWISDIGEISVPIRPDLSGINPATCWVQVHISGIYHWVVVLDGANGILYVYDLDKNAWMPPRVLSGPASALLSAETSLGNVNLVIAMTNGKSLMMVPGTYTDDVTAYSSTGITNLMRMTPDSNPSFQGTHAWTELKTDAVPPTEIWQLVDDDPSTGAYLDVSANIEPSPLLAHQGVNLQSWRITEVPESGSFVSMKYVWPADGKNFRLYQIDDAFNSAGG